MHTHHRFAHRAIVWATLVVMLLNVSGVIAANGHGTIPIQTTQDSSVILTYSIDTIVSYPVAPGVTYTSFSITNSSSKRYCYLFDVDLTNPYIRVEETHATTIGQTEAMVTTHHRLDSAGHRSIGSVNCNFWETKNNEGLVGVACTGQVRNEKIGASITNWGIGVAASLGLPEEDRKQELGFLMIDSQGKAWIDQYSWNSTVRIGQTVQPLREANRNRNNPETDELVLFNSDLGNKATRTADDLYEVVLDVTGDWVINREMHGIVRSTNTTGGTHIDDRQAVLQARGAYKTFLQQAGIGDSIHFTIGIYAALTEEYPQIAQLSAGNCYVMKNYRLQFRNWAEEYNNQNYPRTGFGVSEDHQRLWMLVMQKPGMYTHEMCSILRHFGACYAMGADGGGSAQLNLGGQIVNPTTEANPRAVSNAIFLFSTAPDDDTPVNLLYHDASDSATTLPTYASYAPHLRAYNQYGMMIADEYPDYQLSCEPASLGTISEDGKVFTAAGIGGDGILIATAGNARVEKAIHIEPSSIRIAWDSIVCDLRPFPMEVYSQSALGDLPIPPETLTWEVADETICRVDNGLLVGIRNGETMLYGSLNEFVDSLPVRVQIADQEQVTTAVQLDTTLNYSSTRGAAVDIYMNTTIYGRPDSVALLIYSEPQIKSATVISFAADCARHTSKAHISAYTSQEPMLTHRIVLEPSIFTDAPDPGSYPFGIEKFKCMFDNIQKNTDYHFSFVEMVCYYSSWQELAQALPAIPAETKTFKFVIDGQVYIMNNNKIFDIHGKQIR